MCDNDGWKDSVAQVVCRQLGFSGGTAQKFNQTTTSHVVGRGRVPVGHRGHIMIIMFACNGQEMSLDQCSATIRYGELSECKPAHVRCETEKFNSIEIKSQSLSSREQALNSRELTVGGSKGERLIADWSEYDSWFVCQRQEEMPFIS